MIATLRLGSPWTVPAGPIRLCRPRGLLAAVLAVAVAVPIAILAIGLSAGARVADRRAASSNWPADLEQAARALGGSGNDALDGGTDPDTCDGAAGTDTATDCETVVGVP